MKKSLLLSLLTGVSLSCANYTDPLTPDEALKSFTLRDDRLTVDIFATEPQVLDPVDMVFDENGDAYVVEMPDYPSKPEDGTLNGAIRLLQDTDNDGRIDSVTVFADKLSEATSILPWQGGLLVAAAPHIYFMKDTTGDHRADVREVLFSGFFASNSEAQITNLHYGIDNWIYASNCGQAGEITYTRDPNAKPVSIKGGDFRFRLDRGQFEIESSSGQFGMAIDDWGNRFFTENSLHAQHTPIPARYLFRHPFLASYDVALNISDHDPEMFQETPPPYWRKERTIRRNQQFEDAGLDRHEYAEDHFTGASGGTYYGGTLLPKEYQGALFTGEVAGNLIHRDVLVPAKDSPTFVARRGETEKTQEFLYSTDPWFRPAQLSVGPDGVLYVIDMYRQHIETPTAIPEDLKKDMDFFNGSKLGRIYRIIPKDTRIGTTRPALRAKTPAGLVALLGHPQQWWRLQAQRLLLEKGDKTIIPAVKSVFLTHTDARARLHAFFVLEGLNALDDRIISKAMQDRQPDIRRYGIRQAEKKPAFLPQIIALTNDPSVQVAYQACLSLGEFPATVTSRPLARVLAKTVDDKWFRMGVLSAPAGSSVAFIGQLQQDGFLTQLSDGKRTFLEEYGHVIGARNRNGEPGRLLTQWEGNKPVYAALLKGITAGLKKAELMPDVALKARLDELMQQADSVTRENIKAVLTKDSAGRH
ncbi:PVC-type heme-binding CxxCH protein [Arsenicibacter rosenii]|uniref:Dehydrogenase n=1 Tax=Arsenicibacter rosenii TaxID=1750698 RepID=A0A1S2VQ24_9BACT|nr:PVC-type heme-binding CxxCH protein [Arsenicibacter rosenii]OIN60862.1 dehydrogenase [Arsenicibacter rosenii]